MGQVTGQSVSMMAKNIQGVSKLSVQIIMGDREHHNKRLFLLNLFLFCISLLIENGVSTNTKG